MKDEKWEVGGGKGREWAVGGLGTISAIDLRQSGSTQGTQGGDGGSK